MRGLGFGILLARLGFATCETVVVCSKLHVERVNTAAVVPWATFRAPSHARMTSAPHLSPAVHPNRSSKKELYLDPGPQPLVG